VKVPRGKGADAPTFKNLRRGSIETQNTPRLQKTEERGRRLRRRGPKNPLTLWKGARGRRETSAWRGARGTVNTTEVLQIKDTSFRAGGSGKCQTGGRANTVANQSPSKTANQELASVLGVSGRADPGQRGEAVPSFGEPGVGQKCLRRSHAGVIVMKRATRGTRLGQEATGTSIRRKAAYGVNVRQPYGAAGAPVDSKEALRGVRGIRCICCF